MILTPKTVKCPRCGAEVDALPGIPAVCARCGAKVFVPPPPSKYDGCIGETKEVEELLERVRRRGATLEEEVLLEFYRQVGLLEC